MVLCYGGIALETVIELPYTPIPGVAHIICEERARLGGGAAHVAEWLASWGVPTRLAGYVLGQDADGDRLLSWLRAYPSLDLRFVEQSAAAHTLVSRTVPLPDGNRYLLCIGYADVTLTPPRPELLAGITHLEVAFYRGQERGNAAAAEMARLAAERGIPIVAMDVLTPDEARALPALALIVNSSASVRERLPSVDEPWAYARSLQQASGASVVLTDGEREVFAVERDGSAWVVEPPSVPVVDTTGAGDGLRAGLLYGLVQAWPLPDALCWATAVGALQVQRSLSQAPPPSQRQIEALARQITVRPKPR